MSFSCDVGSGSPQSLLPVSRRWLEAKGSAPGRPDGSPAEAPLRCRLLAAQGGPGLCSPRESCWFAPSPGGRGLGVPVAAWGGPSAPRPGGARAQPPPLGVRAAPRALGRCRCGCCFPQGAAAAACRACPGHCVPAGVPHRARLGPARPPPRPGVAVLAASCVRGAPRPGDGCQQLSHVY